MSVLRYPLFFLPIHHYTYERYYQRHDEYLEREKKKVEKEWDQPFNQISDENKRWLEESWWWPPWKFNDIVGYLDIGMDIGNCLTGDVFLKRKYFPKDHRNRRSTSKSRNNEILYFREINKIPVRDRSNDSYLQSLDIILKEAKKILKKRNRNFELWLPPFDFSCINFVEAHRQAKIKDLP